MRNGWTRTALRFIHAAAFLLAGVHGAGADADALWKIVGGTCVPEAWEGLPPDPCASVDLVRGVAVLKDREGVAQYLAIPTAKVTGIEDLIVLVDGETFVVGWETRALVERKLKRALPRDAVSLAVNSMNGRTQNQLHVHVDCLDQRVRAALATAPVGDAWGPFPALLAGHRYIARRIAGETLAGVNPFWLLAQQVQGPIGDWTLVVVGANPGFVLLAQNDANASGEQLQDHACHGY